jgi:hypothetical protein
MEFRTLDDVSRFNAKQRQELVAMVTEAGREQCTWRPAPEKWSMQEHFEHVALLMQLLAPVIAELTAKAPPATPATTRDVDCLAVMVASGIANTKFKAPPPTMPQGRSVPESLALLERSHHRILACAERFPALDTDKVTYLHPAGAEVNLAQLWHLIGLHDNRHIEHMRANMAAWESQHEEG